MEAVFCEEGRWLLCSGNKETLLTIPLQRNQDVREELLKFHERHYSSNVMALTVLGKGLQLFLSYELSSYLSALCWLQ